MELFPQACSFLFLFLATEGFACTLWYYNSLFDSLSYVLKLVLGVDQTCYVLGQLGVLGYI
jgi:hypothetical protein